METLREPQDDVGDAEAFFEHLIAPVSLSDFFHMYWDRRPCVFRGPDGVADAILSLGTFDKVVSSSNLKYPFFRLFKSGEALPTCDMTTECQLAVDREINIADLNVVYSAVAAGYTLELQQVERTVSSVRSACDAVQRYLCLPVHAYAYFTAGAEPGFAPHFDTHHVFVRQISGRKRWRVWEPSRRFPLAQDYAPDGDTVKAAISESAPILETTLQAGEGLFVPRGFVHEVLPDEEHSLHISLSVTPLCWIDLLRAQFRRAILDSQDDPAYRKRLMRPLREREYDAPSAEFSSLAEKLLGVYSVSEAKATLNRLQRDTLPSARRPRLAEIDTRRKRSASG